MSLIYCAISWEELLDSTTTLALKQELDKYPHDEFDELKEESLSAGLFSVRLRKPPFPKDRIVQFDDIIIIADARLDYREDLAKKLNLETQSTDLLSDIEFIKLSYIKWGRKCVDYLEGDYVFLIVNKKSRKIWGARDVIGFRPLFFIQTHNELVFSTSLRALLKLKLVEPKLNEDFWANRLLDLDCSPSATPHQNIHQIPIGHEVSFNKDSYESQRYYHWKREVSNKTSAELEIELENILENAVASRMYTDFEIGSALSGGLDSSAVTAIASKQLAAYDQSRKLWAASSVAQPNRNHPKDERPWIEKFSAFFPNVNQALFTFKERALNSKDHFEMFAFMRFRRYATFLIEDKFHKHFEEQNCKTYLTGWRGDHFISRHSFYSWSEILTEGNLLFYVKYFIKGMQWRKVARQSAIKKIIKCNFPINSKIEARLSVLNKSWKKKLQFQIEEKAKEEKKWRKRGIAWDFNRLLPKAGKELLYYMEDVSNQNTKPLYTLHPLSDARLIKFALNLPAEEFEKGGYSRSIFRRSLKNILPEAFRMRQDKGYFIYNEMEQIHCLVSNLLNQYEKELENSQFNELTNHARIMKTLKEFQKTNVADLKMTNDILQSLNLIGYFLYFNSVED